MFADQEDERLGFAIGQALTRGELSEAQAVRWLEPIAAKLGATPARPGSCLCLQYGADSPRGLPDCRPRSPAAVKVVGATKDSGITDRGAVRSGHRLPVWSLPVGSNQEATVASTTSMPAITHVAVTVTDLDASRAWYSKVLGVEPVLDEDTGPFRHVVYLVGNTLLGLHGFPDLVSTEPFNERRPGLDHIAFGFASRDELAEWAVRLDDLGVARSDIVDASYGSGLSFRDPDNIALELFAPAG